MLNESSITGESLPVTRQTGELLLSGTINAGDALKMHAARAAKDSTLQGIISVVEQAGQARAPAVRLADRYAAGSSLSPLALPGWPGW